MHFDVFSLINVVNRILIYYNQVEN